MRTSLPCMLTPHESCRNPSPPAAGWVVLGSAEGQHRQFKHGSKPGRVTVPGKPSDDLAPGTQNSILKQAGLK